MDRDQALKFLEEQPKTFSSEKEAIAFLEEDKPSPVVSGAVESLKNIGRVYPALETVASLATQTYGLPVSGLVGLAGLPFGKGKEWQEAVADTLIYQPQTKGGQQLTEGAFYPIHQLEKGATKVGEKVLEKTGSPALATAAHTAIMGGPMLLPGMRRFKKPKLESLEPKKSVGASELIKDEFDKRFKVDEPQAAQPKMVAENVPEAPPARFQPLKLREYPTEIVKSPRPKTPEEFGATRITRQTPKIETPVDKVSRKLDVTFNGMWDTAPIGGKKYMFTDNKTRSTFVADTLDDVPRKLAETRDRMTNGKTLYSGIPVSEMGKFWTNTVGTFVWDNLVQKRMPKLLEKIPGGKAVNRALIYNYRADLPNTAKYIRSMEDMRRAQSVGREYGIDLGRRLQQFPEESQIRLGEFIRGNESVKLSPLELSVAREAKLALYDLGKQAVDVGLLGEETFFKNAGRYMPRLYTSKEYQSLLTRYNLTKPNRLDLTRFKKRKDIPKEIRQEMGEILTPGYPVAKGITQLTHDISTARWFNGIASNADWSRPKGVDLPIPEGWKQLPSNKKLGKLYEAHVHPEIFADLQETIRVMGKGEKVWRRALGAWKYGKVIISPKTHARNLMSNSILAHLGGLPMYEQPIYLTKAFQAMRDKGDYWKAAKQEGLLDRTWTNAELRELFSDVESQMKGLKAGGLPEKLGVIGNAWEKVKSGGRGASKLYEAEEQWFKMAKMIHNIERKKMSPAAAAADAEKWLFNYAKVTKAQEKYRSKWYGAPFATFTFKAIPRIAEAAIKTPWRFALPGAIIYALEKASSNLIEDTSEQRKAKRGLLEDWMKGQVLGMPNFARVPIVDEYGREHYLNLTYILPWGDLGEAGGLGPIPGSLMPFSQPFVKEAVEQRLNYDNFFKNEIVPEERLAGKSSFGKFKTQVAERGKHAIRTLAPTPVIDIWKAFDAIQGNPDYRGRFRDKKTVAMDVFAGIKIYPVDYTDNLVRKIQKVNPKGGWIANKLQQEIKRLAIKRNAMVDRGKDTAYYDEEIEERILQLKGLAKEVEEIGTLGERIK